MTISSDDYSVLKVIGNTPLVKLKNILPRDCADIYIKLEYLNPTGSYKDRMALAIIEEAEKRGSLKPGDTVVECTAGGTGTSLAMVCCLKGYKFRVISSDAFAPEKLKAIVAYGAQLEIVKSESGKITPDLIPRMIERARELGQLRGTFWTQQFDNRAALAGYEVMGEEILARLPGPASVFCAAVGTAGMLTGVAVCLKKRNSLTKVVVLEPTSSPIISDGIKGTHSVDGISVGFVPPLLDRTCYDEVRMIDEKEAGNMARRLASEEGIFAGTSTGLNVVAALQLGIEAGPGHNIVTVACDSGFKYLSGTLFG
jgi:cysteine synthase